MGENSIEFKYSTHRVERKKTCKTQILKNNQGKRINIKIVSTPIVNILAFFKNKSVIDRIIDKNRLLIGDPYPDHQKYHAHYRTNEIAKQA